MDKEFITSKLEEIVKNSSFGPKLEPFTRKAKYAFDSCVFDSGTMLWQFRFQHNDERSALELTYKNDLFRLHTWANFSESLYYETLSQEEAVNKFALYLGFIGKGEVPKEDLPPEHFQRVAALSNIETKLLEISKNNKVVLSSRKVDEQEVISKISVTHYWEVEGVYKGIDSFLMFAVQLNHNKATHYHISGGVKKYPSRVYSEFLDIKPFSAYSLHEALDTFNTYVGFLINQNIPSEYLPKQNIWVEAEKIDYTPPEGFDKVPVFEVIKDFELINKEERLTVRRVFASCEESLDVIYNGHELEERVYIKNGKISNVLTYLPPKYVNPDDFEDDGEFTMAFLSSLSRKEAPRKTYHHIKSYENNFKELPWQEDFKAIYSGSGLFES